MKHLFRKNALDYHSLGRPGKIEVIPTKPAETQRDLSLAYTPGVAEPCLKIKENPEDIYKYTAKSNLVAVITNGTAVLGLGDIGAQASKPVMEGKGLLFKIYADLDVFDIEIDEKSPEKLIEHIIAIAPTFGGINLEDIKAPECFNIEKTLQKALDIPVMHDDQHGTAIITSAALINATNITGKEIAQIKIVVSGAGASAISCSNLYLSLGAKRENITMFDSKGMLHHQRSDLNEYKKAFAQKSPPLSLKEALKDADMFLGLSTGNILTSEDLQNMAPDPIVFALANPIPEISYEEATSSRNDIIFATGRSDFPNQVNNVLGFPYIFRGAMDVRATCINDDMKLAASKALAELARQPVPEHVNLAYNSGNIHFGKNYIIPKPCDQRLLSTIAPAVARAAIKSGVARNPITNWEEYTNILTNRMGYTTPLIQQIKRRARAHPMRLVFAEAEQYKILKAAEIVKSTGIAQPILLGNRQSIIELITKHELALEGIPIIDPRASEQKARIKAFAQRYFNKRKRRGVTLKQAQDYMLHRNFFAPMMVETDMADTLLNGLTSNYPNTIRPALQIIGKHPESKVVSGMYILNTHQGPIFFADTTVNMNPNKEILCEIALQSAEVAKKFNIEPHIAFLSYSNFGSSKGRIPTLVRDTVTYLHTHYPELIVDGDLQANFAVNQEKLKENFPFSKLAETGANILIFPYLTAGNIAYKLLQELGQQEAYGPILMGMKKPVHILQMDCSVTEIVNMAAIAVVDAQHYKQHHGIKEELVT